MAEDDRLARIEALLVAMQKDLGTLKGDVGTLKGDVGKLKGDVAYLKGKADIHEAKLIVMDEKLSETKHAVELVDVRVKGLEQLPAAVSNVQSQQTAFTGAFVNLATQVTVSKTLESRVDRLEAAIFPKPH